MSKRKKRKNDELNDTGGVDDSYSIDDPHFQLVSGGRPYALSGSDFSPYSQPKPDFDLCTNLVNPAIDTSKINLFQENLSNIKLISDGKDLAEAVDVWCKPFKGINWGESLGNMSSIVGSFSDFSSRMAELNSRIQNTMPVFKLSDIESPCITLSKELVSTASNPFLNDAGVKFEDGNIFFGSDPLPALGQDELDDKLEKVKEEIETKYEEKDRERVKEHKKAMRDLKKAEKAVMDLKEQTEKDKEDLQAALEALKRFKDVPRLASPVIDRAERDLFLLWDGYSIVDRDNKDVYFNPRKGFLQKVLNKCFEDIGSPKRRLRRKDLEMKPQKIKGSVKSLVTHWSEKFSVPRVVIEELIYFDDKDGSLVISEKIVWSE